jgi:hypothetical protein
MQQVELDIMQSQLNVEMAERQLAITQRTGRRLDVEQALLNVQKSQRDMNLQIFDAETQRIETERSLITSSEQQETLKQSAQPLQ